MTWKEILDSTDSSYVYNKAYKIELNRRGLISCSRCPYHRKENREPMQRTWKVFRKTQWKS